MTRQILTRPPAHAGEASAGLIEGLQKPDQINCVVVTLAKIEESAAISAF